MLNICSIFFCFRFLFRLLEEKVYMIFLASVPEKSSIIMCATLMASGKDSVKS